MLIAFYIARKAEIEPHQKVFSFDMDKYRAAVNQTLVEMGLGDMDLGPHLLRHCCAVFYKHYEDWKGQRIRERLRWGTEEAMRHYQKVHLLIKNEGRAKPEEMARGHWLWEDATRFGLKMPVPSVNSLYPSLQPLAQPSTQDVAAQLI